MLVAAQDKFRAQGKCASCPRKSGPICGGLSPADLNRLGAEGHIRRLEAGASFLAQSEAGDRVGILVDGFCKISHMKYDGTEQVLHILRPGELIGDPLGSRSPVSYEAASNMTVCEIPTRRLAALSAEFPTINLAFHVAAVRLLQAQLLHRSALMARKTLARVAYWLLEQSDGGDTETGAVIEITLSRASLASYLGMTVETFCRNLHELKSRGAIALPKPNRVEIANSARLRALAEWDEEDSELHVASVG